MTTLKAFTGPDLRALRERHHLTREQLAVLLDVSYRTVVRWEEPTAILPLVTAVGVQTLLKEYGRSA